MRTTTDMEVHASNVVTLALQNASAIGGYRPPHLIVVVSQPTNAELYE